MSKAKAGFQGVHKTKKVPETEKPNPKAGFQYPHKIVIEDEVVSGPGPYSEKISERRARALKEAAMDEKELADTQIIERSDDEELSEDDDGETSPELDEAEFRECVREYATQYGVETAKHLFAVELQRIPAQKKQKTESKP